MLKALTKYTVSLIGLFLLVAVQLSAHSKVNRVYVKGIGFCEYTTEQSHLHLSGTSTKIDRQFWAEEVETEIEEEDNVSKKQSSTDYQYVATLFNIGLAQLTSTQTNYLQHQQQEIYAVTPRYISLCVFRI